MADFVVIATWPFGRMAVDVAAPLLRQDKPALDAAIAGAQAVEDDPKVDSVGYGGLPNAISYLMDGASNNDPFNNLNLPLPFPDALQEFKVETSALPAQYGQHSGGAVKVVTKSGSNELHGDVFEFVRNYIFNARNPGALARDSLKRLMEE